MEWFYYPLIFIAGGLAGITNTLAGSGSLITLPALVFLGLPADVANGTNRIGIIVQSVTGVETFRRGGKLRTEGVGWLIAPTVLGAIVGAWIASQMSADQMNTVIGIVMVSMLLVLLVDPTSWLREESELHEERPPWWLLGVFFIVGIYGGFIQAGVGIMLLATLVLGAGYEAVEANAVKLLIAVIFTTVALAIFVYQGQVDWLYGLLMAVGQGTGGWLAAKFAVDVEDAGLWIRRLLIVIVIASAGKFLGVWGWVFG